MTKKHLDTSDHQYGDEEIRAFTSSITEEVGKPRSKFEPDLSFLDQSQTAYTLQKLIGAFVAETAPRISVRQMLAFMIFANADVRGAPVTMQFLRELMLPNQKHELFSASVSRSFDVFFEPDDGNAETEERLGWLYRETDEFDKRLKYMRLTPAGKTIYRNMLSIIH